MSKELEALNKIFYIAVHQGNKVVDIRKDYEIIKSAFERKEQLENEKITKELSLEIKKNRALEIIKEKDVNIHNFKVFVIEQKWTYEQYLAEENDPNTNGHQFAYKHLTEEEFGLLKEVLL